MLLQQYPAVNRLVAISG